MLGCGCAVHHYSVAFLCGDCLYSFVDFILNGLHQAFTLFDRVRLRDRSICGAVRLLISLWRQSLPLSLPLCASERVAIWCLIALVQSLRLSSASFSTATLPLPARLDPNSSVGTFGRQGYSSRMYSMSIRANFCAPAVMPTGKQQ